MPVGSADEFEPQVNAEAPVGDSPETPLTAEAAAPPDAGDPSPPETPSADAVSAPADGTPDASTGSAPQPAEGTDVTPANQPEAPAEAPTASAPQPSADQPAAEAAGESSDAPSQGDAAESSSEAPEPRSEGEAPAGADSAGAAPSDTPAEGEGASEGDAASGDQTKTEGEDKAEGEGGDGPKRKRRPRGRRHGRGGGQRGGPRRFQWDEVFLRQRLELLRAMDPDPVAIAWAVQNGGRFDVADILAGEGSSGREFGRRAYAATPETDDQASWIILSAVRARDIIPLAREAVSGTSDQREQVKTAIERLGIARINPALQGERPAQQVFAERAQRVDLTGEGGEEQKAAWALLSLARPQDVRTAAAPPRPRSAPSGRPGDDDRRGRQRRDPGIPGGVFSVGESGIGGELGAKLRAALAAAEGSTPSEAQGDQPAAADDASAND